MVIVTVRWRTATFRLRGHVKCRLFISRPNNFATLAALAEVCALLSEHSSLLKLKTHFMATKSVALAKASWEVSEQSTTHLPRSAAPRTLDPDRRPPGQWTLGKHPDSYFMPWPVIEFLAKKTFSSADSEVNGVGIKGNAQTLLPRKPSVAALYANKWRLCSANARGSYCRNYLTATDGRNYSVSHPLCWFRTNSAKFVFAMRTSHFTLSTVEIDVTLAAYCK